MKYVYHKSFDVVTQKELEKITWLLQITFCQEFLLLFSHETPGLRSVYMYIPFKILIILFLI